MCLRTLAARIKKVGGTESMGATLAASAEMTDFDGLYIRVQSKYDSCKLGGVAEESCKTLITDAKRLLEEAKEIVAKAREMNIAQKEADFKEKFDYLVGILGIGKVDAGKLWWHDMHEKSQSDFEACELLCTNTFRDYQADTLKQKLKECEVAAKSYENALRSSGKVEMPPEIDQMPKVQILVSAAACAMQLFFFFSKPAAADIRAQLQREVRELRKRGWAEKELLPHALFKRTYEGLMKPKQA